MLKRIVYGGGLAGALTAAYLVGSLTLGGAFAQTAPAPTAPAQSQAEQPEAAGAPETAESTGANEQSEAAALASQAKITADQAKAAALAQFPGATAGRIELDNENGTVVYSVKLTDSAGKRQDVKVDASTGKVLQSQAEGAETPGSGGQEGPDAQD